MECSIGVNELKKLWDCVSEPDIGGFGELRYRFLTETEYEEYMLSVINALVGGFNSPIAGNHRRHDWQSGWEENLKELKETKDIISLIPKYHGKHKYVRWRQRPILPLTPKFDVLILNAIVSWLAKDYLSFYKHIYEFGCGSCYHLQQLRYSTKAKTITGLDWADSSGNIIKEFNDIYGSDLRWRKFDFLNPDFDVDIPRNSAFFTVAALEQVGVHFREFLHFCMLKKPALCVHVEPIEELLDENNLMDKLSIHYFRKRHYLRGFLTDLREMERAGDIEILRAQRTYTGSYFIEGHSVVVWRPL